VNDFRFRDAIAGDEPAIRALVFGVLAEYGLAPDRDDTDRDLDDLSAAYASRGGCFRVVYDATRIVGCGGLYRVDAEEAEIRKMYLLPEARGRGLGRKMLLELLETARQRGVARVVAETASVLRDAIALYVENGFVPLDRRPAACRCDLTYVLYLRR
jgi:putative acetyltransferase